MSGFNERERGEESRFAHDAELTFKATVRRDRKVGHWIASEFLGIEGEAAADFAGQVVASNFEKPGDDDVVDFVLSKVKERGGELTEARLRHRMEELLREALAELKAQS
jgi:hypothetical protein